MSAEGLSAFILAGTHHWNGSSFERLAPRPLLPVALAPLLSYSLRWLRRGGVRRATICSNGITRAIEAALGNGARMEMELGYHQDEMPRGPAGCVRDAGEHATSETLVVTDGTAIPTVDFRELLASHQASQAAMTVVVHRQLPSTTPPTPGGVYLLQRRVLDHIAEHGFQDIKENLIPRLHRAGERVMAYPSEGSCPQVVNASTYLAVNEWMLQRLAREAPGGALLHRSACVEPGGRLVGPVQLGPGARVEPGATIIGPTSIGAGSVVGRDALVARSVVWGRCLVGEGSMVHACVVGENGVIPPAARLFNIVNPRAEAAGQPQARPSGPGKAADSAPQAGRAFGLPLPNYVLTSRTIG